MRQVTTTSVAARERFDFWRSQFSGLEMRLPGKGDAPFRAELTQCVARGGVYFAHVEVDPLVNRYCATPSEGSVFLTRVLGGRVEMSEPGGSPMVTTGGLFLTDSSRPLRVRHGRYAIAYLRLPRSRVVDALGGDPLPGRAGVLELANEGLAPFLSSQLQLLSQRGTGLSAGQRAAAVDASVDLAFALIRDQLRAPPEARDLSGQGLFTAAKLYIERHCHQPELTPEGIAHALGCSRARLYRLFAERDLAVFELIRQTRLQRSLALLRAHPGREVSGVAFECGYDDPPTFNRAFKRRFGMTPSEWRAEQSPRETSAPRRSDKRR